MSFKYSLAKKKGARVYNLTRADYEKYRPLTGFETFIEAIIVVSTLILIAAVFKSNTANWWALVLLFLGGSLAGYTKAIAKLVESLFMWVLFFGIIYIVFI